MFNTGSLTSTHDTFSENSSISYGGGVYNSGSLVSTTDTFAGNSAANGGGIENLNLLNIVHDTFTTNARLRLKVGPSTTKAPRSAAEICSGPIRRSINRPAARARASTMPAT